MNDSVVLSGPKVSVIVPNYNHARFLERRLQTILNQRYQNIEIILLDDCSTDNSRTILESYRNHPKVTQLIFNDSNSGSPFAQWVKGIQVATGEWIWIAETDDYASTDLLDRLVSAALALPSCGMAYCDSQAIDNNGEIIDGYIFSEIKNKQFANTHWASDYTNTGIAELEDYMLIGGTVNNTSAALFKSSLLQVPELFDFPFRYIGDKFVFVKVLAQRDIAYVNAPLNFYRIDTSSNAFLNNRMKYCLEQFQIFHWIHTQRIPLDKTKLKRAFNSILSNSFYSGWNMYKIRVFLKMISMNPILFFRFAFFNITNPLKRKLRS